jgi:choline-sulfatase
LSRRFRFTFIIGLVGLASALAAIGGWRYARASAPVSGPIILISIDTLRADRLPVYGYQGVRTPAIDALARDGVVFERAYSHVPQSLPAHAALLSGRLPFETGVRDNAGFTVASAERLLPEMLRDRGYRTAGIVSSYVLRKETGIGQGFTFFDADIPPDPSGTSVTGLHRDGAESERIAEDWLTASGTERAFLFLHLYEPHKPYAAPARFAEYEVYDGEIAYVDEIVGRLVKYLKTHQVYDQSTIILLSDHGEGLGDHGEDEHGLFIYEETIRVPLIVKPAAGEGAGQRVSDLVQHVDIVPTILDLAKAPVPGNLRGQSLKPLLDGVGRLPERTVYAESLYGWYRFGWSPLTSLTDGRRRYIRAAREELYDLQEDSAEQENLALTGAREQSGLSAALDRLLGGTDPQAPGEVSTDDQERLEALGYVGTPRQFVATGTELPDPKDTLQILEMYREAVEQVASGQWLQAMERLQALVRRDPLNADLWSRLGALAFASGRYEQTVGAYERFVALRPNEADGYLGAAAALLRLRRLENAQDHAELATMAANPRARASAHELLAKIALARRDAPTAREQAELASKADPGLPMPVYVEGRIRYDQGRYADALPLFERALAALVATAPRQISELHFYAADSFMRLEEYAEAEAHALEELRYFPQNVRARAWLAMLYDAMERTDEAHETLNELVRRTPTPEAYNLAARAWTSIGNPRRAAAVRAEAQRVLSQSGRLDAGDIRQ